MTHVEVRGTKNLFNLINSNLVAVQKVHQNEDEEVRVPNMKQKLEARNS